MFKQVSDTSFYRAEVSECYPFFIMVIYYGVLLVFFCFLVVSFFLRLFTIYMGYPLFFAMASIVSHSSFFMIGECYHPIYIVSECCNLVLVWMVRGKLDCCISTCSFPVDSCCCYFYVW